MRGEGEGGGGGGGGGWGEGGSMPEKYLYTSRRQDRKLAKWASFTFFH